MPATASLAYFLSLLGVAVAAFLLGAWTGGKEVRKTLVMQVNYVRVEVEHLLANAINDVRGAVASNALPLRVTDVIGRLEVALGILKDLPRK